MVDVKFSPAVQKMKDRIERVRKNRMHAGIRVEPKNEDIRRVLRHPKAGGFRSEGSIEWPDDTFTQRRLRDGDIKLVEDKPRAAPKAS